MKELPRVRQHIYNLLYAAYYHKKLISVIEQFIFSVYKQMQNMFTGNKHTLEEWYAYTFNTCCFQVQLF